MPQESSRRSLLPRKIWCKKAAGSGKNKCVGNSGDKDLGTGSESVGKDMVGTALGSSGGDMGPGLGSSGGPSAGGGTGKKRLGGKAATEAETSKFGAVKVHTADVLGEAGVKTYVITNKTTSKDLVNIVLSGFDVICERKNLFQLCMGKSESNSTPLDDEARPLELQGRRQKGENRLYLHLANDAGVINVIDKAIQSESPARRVFITDSATCRDVIHMVLKFYGTEPETDNYEICHVNSTSHDFRRLNLLQRPLVINTEHMEADETHFEIKQNTMEENLQIRRSHSLEEISEPQKLLDLKEYRKSQIPKTREWRRSSLQCTTLGSAAPRSAEAKASRDGTMSRLRDSLGKLRDHLDKIQRKKDPGSPQEPDQNDNHHKRTPLQQNGGVSSRGPRGHIAIPRDLAVAPRTSRNAVTSQRLEVYSGEEGRSSRGRRAAAETSQSKVRRHKSFMNESTGSGDAPAHETLADVLLDKSRSQSMLELTPSLSCSNSGAGSASAAHAHNATDTRRMRRASEDVLRGGGRYKSEARMSRKHGMSEENLSSFERRKLYDQRHSRRRGSDGRTLCEAGAGRDSLADVRYDDRSTTSGDVTQQVVLRRRDSTSSSSSAKARNRRSLPQVPDVPFAADLEERRRRISEKALGRALRRTHSESRAPKQRPTVSPRGRGSHQRGGMDKGEEDGWAPQAPSSLPDDPVTKDVEEQETEDYVETAPTPVINVECIEASALRSEMGSVSPEAGVRPREGEPPSPQPLMEPHFAHIHSAHGDGMTSHHAHDLNRIITDLRDAAYQPIETIGAQHQQQQRSDSGSHSSGCSSRGQLQPHDRPRDGPIRPIVDRAGSNQNLASRNSSYSSYSGHDGYYASKTHLSPSHLTPESRHSEEGVSPLHPALHQIIQKCELRSVSLVSDGEHHGAGESKPFGLELFEAAFSAAASPQREPRSAFRSPSGRRPLLGQGRGAFMPVGGVSAGDMRPLVAVDSVADGSVAQLQGDVRPGDYLLEVNGEYVGGPAGAGAAGVAAAVRLLRGRPGRAHLVLARPGAGQNSGAVHKEYEKLEMKYAAVKQENEKHLDTIADLRIQNKDKIAIIQRLSCGIKMKDDDLDALKAQCNHLGEKFLHYQSQMTFKTKEMTRVRVEMQQQEQKIEHLKSLLVRQTEVMQMHMERQDRSAANYNCPAETARYGQDRDRESGEYGDYGRQSGGENGEYGRESVEYGVENGQYNTQGDGDQSDDTYRSENAGYAPHENGTRHPDSGAAYPGEDYEQYENFDESHVSAV